MNNYWETNYKAAQEGPTTFRYSIRPHGRFDPAAAARFGIECSQPLVAVPAAAATSDLPSLFKVGPPGVIVTRVKPVPKGKGWIVRLFGASGRPERAVLTCPGRTRARIWLSDLDGEKRERVRDAVHVPPYGIVTLRVSGQ